MRIKVVRAFIVPALLSTVFSNQAFAAPTTLWKENEEFKKQMRAHQQVFQKRTAIRDPIVKFDYPIEYNRQVQFWVRHFQTEGRKVFTNWLKRSQKYLPLIQKVLKDEGLPQDLAYIPMIESGFVAQAVSPAQA